MLQKRLFLWSFVAVVSLPLGRVCGQERILKDSVDSLLSAEEVSDDWLEHLLEQDDERGPSEFSFRGDLDEERTASLDVNQVTEEELLATGLLSPYAVRQFLAARHRRGGSFSSLRELKQIEGWDLLTLRRILPFLTLSRSQRSVSLRDMLAQGSLKGQITLGYALQPTSLKDHTLGSPLSLYAKGQYQMSHRYSIGFLGASQRYEPMLNPSYAVLDRWSGHFAVQYPEQYLRMFTLGDFRLRLGLGLIAYQGLMRGVEVRSQEPLSGMPIQPILSADEENSLRGIATEVGNRRFRLTLFYSSRRRDGSLDAWSRTALLANYSGYHRTGAEWLRRHKVREQLLGGRLSYHAPRYAVSLNYLSTQWPGYSLDRLPHYGYISTGSRFSRMEHLSLDYRFSSLSGRWHGTGEVAFSSRSGRAAVAFLGYRDPDYGDYTLSARYLSHSFEAPLGNTLTHYAYPGNEVGCFLSGSISAFAPLDLKLTGDLYRSLTPRFHRSSCTMGSLLLAQMNYPLQPDWWLGAEYRLRQEQGNGAWHRGRLRSRIGLTSSLKAQVEVQMKWSYPSEVVPSRVHRGLSTSFRLDYTPSDHYRIGGLVSYYRADSFAERWYYFVPYVRSAPSFTAFYGEGLTAWGYARLRLATHWAVEAKVARHRSLVHSSLIHTSTPSFWDFALSLHWI